MKETRICANCGAEHPIEDMFEVEGDWLCEDCADRLTVICDHCNERIYEGNAVEDDTHILCEHCFDEYYVRCSLGYDNLEFTFTNEPYLSYVTRLHFG